MRDNDKKSVEDVAGVNKLLFSEQLAPYKAYFSLANTKYSGTALLIRKDKIQKPKFCRFNLDDEDKTNANVHDEDGRVIFVGFEGFAILHT